MAVRRIWLILVLVPCAFLAHYAVVSDAFLGHAAWIAMLFIPACWRGLRCRNHGLLCLVVLSGAAALFVAANTPYVVGLLPLAAYGLLFSVFGMTLLPGRKPLVSALAELAHGKLEPRVARYTRRVTQVWTVFFAAVLVEMVSLAVLAPVEVWSLFVTLLNGIFVILLFLVEYWVRRRCLRDFDHLGFREYLRFLSTIDPRAIAWN
jgi:uncharacterized membrane protein